MTLKQTMADDHVTILYAHIAAILAGLRNGLLLSPDGEPNEWAEYTSLSNLQAFVDSVALKTHLPTQKIYVVENQRTGSRLIYPESSNAIAAYYGDYLFSFEGLQKMLSFPCAMPSMGEKRTLFNVHFQRGLKRYQFIYFVCRSSETSAGEAWMRNFVDTMTSIVGPYFYADVYER